MHIPPHRGVDLVTEEDEEDLGPLPERHVYVKRVLKKHKQTMSSTHCYCGTTFEGHFNEHIADIVIAASDTWDQLIMAEEE